MLRARWTSGSISFGVPKVKHRAPRPSSPASENVGGLEQANQQRQRACCPRQAFPPQLQHQQRHIRGHDDRTDAMRPVDCRQRVFARLGLADDTCLAVGVDRFDYTKGILERLQAIRAFLEQNPGWVGRLSFIQIAAPTRSKLPSYQQLQHDAASLTEDINRQFGRPDYQPVILIPRHHEPDEVYEYFRAADFCLVSSLHDGMNLVAKEFVAARDDDQGVLILSTFAGASRELPEALIVNPYDPAGMARTITEALTLSPEHQRARMRLMRETVRGFLSTDSVALRSVARTSGGVFAGAMSPYQLPDS